MRSHFIEISIERLKEIRKSVCSQKKISVTDFNSYFRQIHTIKGTAQTFGLSSPAALAHEIEDYLSATQNQQTAFDPHLFSEVLEALENSIANQSFKISDELRQKMHVEDFVVTPDFFSDLPIQVTNRLSASEKFLVNQINQRGENLYLIEMICDMSNFPDRLKLLRTQIEKSGQLLAILPLPMKNAQIGAQLLCSGDLTDEISDTKIVYRKINAGQTLENLSDVCQMLAVRTQKIAFELNKSVVVDTQIEDLEVSPEATEQIFKILLHLSGNAIDHAIETPEERIAKDKPAAGQIKITIAIENKNVLLVISDDGRGINPQLIAKKAIAKNLITDSQSLSDPEKLALILLPGFSTAEKVSEISGRGVGLDAVRETVENLDGTINIESLIDVGTTFKILLPSNKIVKNAETI